MSLNRYNPKRDDNEAAIRKRFSTHGWHTEQRSSSGGWDLDAYPPNPVLLGLCQAAHVDVKMPGKKATKAQVEKWTALSEKGIPVYVASTEADVDAIVGGTATPWAPEVRGSIRAPRPHGNTCHLRPELHPATKPTRHRKTTTYDSVPPRSPPVDASTTSLGSEVMREMMKPPGEEDYRAAIARSLRAAEQAAETFAPKPAAHAAVLRDLCSCTQEQPCAACSVPPRCAVPSCLHATPCPRHSLSALGRP